MNITKTSTHKIFLGGLPQVCNEEDIFDILSKFAKIDMLSLKRRKNRPSGKCLGHGMLFTNEEGSKSLL